MCIRDRQSTAVASAHNTASGVSGCVYYRNNFPLHIKQPTHPVLYSKVQKTTDILETDKQVSSSEDSCDGGFRRLSVTSIEERNLAYVSVIQSKHRDI